MSAGVQTSRAHDRDAAIRWVVRTTDDHRWRTTAEWLDVVERVAYDQAIGALGYRCGRPQVGAVLRAMMDQGLVERRRPTHDLRVVEFRRALHLR